MSALETLPVLAGRATHGTVARTDAWSWIGCSSAPPLLAPGGMLLLVQSALCGVQNTIDLLRSGGLKAAVVAQRRETFGPVMRNIAGELERQGLIRPEQRYEDLVVIRADRIE
jgi:release factor glutamine methyltransferase